MFPPLCSTSKFKKYYLHILRYLEVTPTYSRPKCSITKACSKSVQWTWWRKCYVQLQAHLHWVSIRVLDFSTVNLWINTAVYWGNTLGESAVIETQLSNIVRVLDFGRFVLISSISFFLLEEKLPKGLTNTAEAYYYLPHNPLLFVSLLLLPITIWLYHLWA